MKKLLLLAVSLMTSSLLFAQGDLSLSQYAKLDGATKDGVQGFTDGIQGGLNALEWTDGSGADVFRIGLQIHSGFGIIPASPEIGLKDDVPMPSFGGQVNLGTMGAEVYLRMFPEVEGDGFSYGNFGIGAKYDITDFIPVTGFPSTSVYASYTSYTFKVSGNQEVSGVETIDVGGTPYDATYTTSVDAEISLEGSSFNIGAISSYDLWIIRFFGRVALEMAGSDISWNGAEPDATNVTGDPNSGFVIGTKSFEGGSDFGNSGLRLGFGMSLLGLKGEVGYMNGSYFGVGYGITF